MNLCSYVTKYIESELISNELQNLLIQNLFIEIPLVKLIVFGYFFSQVRKWRILHFIDQRVYYELHTQAM
jgi:hypothetical protein